MPSQAIVNELSNNTTPAPSNELEAFLLPVCGKVEPESPPTEPEPPSRSPESLDPTLPSSAEAEPEPEPVPSLESETVPAAAAVSLAFLVCFAFF